MAVRELDSGPTPYGGAGPYGRPAQPGPEPRPAPAPAAPRPPAPPAAPRPPAAPPAAAPADPQAAAIQQQIDAALAAQPKIGLPTPHPTSLAADPAYLAFQRQLQNQEGVLAANTQDRVDAINRALAERVPALQQQGQLRWQDIAGQMDARGMLGSTQRDMMQARQAAATGAAVSGAQQTAADQIAALQAQLAAQRAALATSGANTVLSAAGNYFGSGG